MKNIIIRVLIIKNFFNTQTLEHDYEKQWKLFGYTTIKCH